MQSILVGLRERYERVYVQDTGKMFNTELMEVVELGFLLECADALVAAALARDESRGGHYREDHPLRDDANWLKHSLAMRQPDGSVAVAAEPPSHLNLRISVSSLVEASNPLGARLPERRQDPETEFEERRMRNETDRFRNTGPEGLGSSPHIHSMRDV